MIGRNVDDHFNKTPTPHFPRSRFDMGIHKRLQTQGHGRLYPFFVRIVYPGDTWQMDMTTFVRADTSLRVPLDDIYLDTYWFFVPFRIIDPNFVKILGEGEPSDYDDVSYGFPSIEIEGEVLSGSINNLLPYLGYSQAAVNTGLSGFTFSFDDEICPYPLMAYYKCYNDWFRDENVDPSVPYGDLMTYPSLSSTYIIDNALFDELDCLKVNRYHDMFSSALISPQKGPAQTIPLGTSAPVGFVPAASGTTTSNSYAGVINGTSVTKDEFEHLVMGADAGVTNGIAGKSVFADLSQAAGTINELRLAFAIQALYERRGRYGTRYISVLRGQWGLEVPDLFLSRPEYLGGSRVTLNNLPVLSTENSSQLGQMSGNSATLAQDGSWSKSFVDYGIILGLSCTRIKHSYSQGKRQELWSLKTQLDLYNPVFANIGMQAIPQTAIFNCGVENETEVFGYQEPYDYLRSDLDSFAGLFGMFSTNSELKNKWHYGDYYALAPKFSATWLKEDYKNVARTMTGQLITGAGSTETEGHQFMFGYYYHPVVTRILPAHSVPVELIGHL